MNSLPPILKGARRWQLATLIALALGQAVAVGPISFATRDVFAALRNGGDAPTAALTVIAAGGIAVAALRYGERVFAERLGQDYAAALRLTIFLHLTRVPARQLGARRVGHLSMRFVGDLSAVRNWISLGLARLVAASIVLPATLAVLFLLDARLATAATVPILLGLVAMAMIGRQFGGAHKRLRSRRARLAADMTERVVHAPELDLLGRTEVESRHLSSRTRSMVRSAIVRARGVALLRAIPDLLAGIVAASVLVTAFRYGVSGAVAAGTLAAVALAVQQLRDLAGVWDRSRAFAAARAKCAKLLRTETMPRSLTRTDGTIRVGPPEVRFEDVSARGLCALNMAVDAGRKVAVVGGNGAGKSTLLALVAGLERPTSGTVTLGGRDVANLGDQERRRMMAYMSARSPILAGSLRRALTMGVPKRAADPIIEACAEAFGLGPVVERLGGLDGAVAEAGRNLSTGEARRLLLARVALSDAPLILLDEPDEALDADCRRLLHGLLQRLEATAMVVTHDFELARSFDEIWLLDQGQLVARGAPEEVLARASAALQEATKRIDDLRMIRKRRQF